MRVISYQLSVLAVLSLLGVFARISHAQQTEPLQIELVSEVTSIQPGQPFHVGLHLQHKEGYHTYWKFPGVVGVPTAVKWDLPRGWKVEDIEWPEPERVFMFKIRAQGYHGEVILPVRITPPQKLEEGSTVTLAGKASWMCCNRECNPGFKDLTLTLPVANSEPAPDKRWTKLFAQARASIPQPMEGWETQATVNDGKVTLRIVPQTAELKKHAASMKDLFFFTEDGLIDPDKEQIVKHDADGSIILEMLVSEYGPKRIPKTLTGVLQSNEGMTPGGIRSVSLSTPLIK
ncbi:hypothetical protein BH11VER1_BH11VER1_20770 [soil metagenome]